MNDLIIKVGGMIITLDSQQTFFIIARILSLYFILFASHILYKIWRG